MNITKLLPDTDLHVYKVTDILTEDELNLAQKLAAGKIPTGYKKDEINELVLKVKNTSAKACEEIFNVDNLQTNPNYDGWRWFDLSAGESRPTGWTKTFAGGGHEYFTELMVQASEGGDLCLVGELFDEPFCPHILPGEMLVISRAVGYETKITEVKSGIRFSLTTLVSDHEVSNRS